VRRRLLALVVVALAAGCGGGGDGNGDGSSSATSGAQIFSEQGCGSCHAFKAAGSTGNVGPNLDDIKPSFDAVVEQVTNGGGGMPSFKDDLSKEQIEAVARYVSSGGSEAAGSGMPVVATFKPDATRLEGCLDADCRRQAFGNIAYREGPKKALDLFDEKQRTDKGVETDCHRIAHSIGAASLLYFDDDIAKALAAGRASCWSGYYHGVVERAFFGTSQRQLASRAREICADSDIRRTTFVAYQCVHGLGHGLMIHTGYDLPLALRVCNRLDTGWDRDSCESGVFMENISSSYGIKSRWLRDDDPIYPCNTVAEKYKLYCYLMATSRILETNGYDWKKTVATCRKSEPRWVATCFQSLGRDASGNTRQDAPKILELCALAGNMARECVYGAARDITSNDASPRRAKGFCETARTALRAYCFEGIGTILGGMYADRAGRRTACLAVTRTYARACFRGALAL
jgi:cytochrome c553